jgi:predicted ATP-grasp superfamily ATP-dependent carboligase
VFCKKQPKEVNFMGTKATPVSVGNAIIQRLIETGSLSQHSVQAFIDGGEKIRAGFGTACIAARHGPHG